MSVEITFEIEGQAEGRHGIVAENTYLWDAAKRLGVKLEDSEAFDETLDDCAVTVKKGAENLSTPTSAEMQHLTDERRDGGERLARQTRIQRSGEIVVMVKKKAESNDAEKERSWREDFQALPFEKKFATLAELEVVALGETVSFVANLPYTISNKVIDVLAGFGWQIDKNSRQARRPQEHHENGEAKTGDAPSNGAAKKETEE
jgi:hypothetical protein